MNDGDLDTAPSADTPIQNRPAVGLQIAPQTSSDAVAGAILRAQRHGHHVFVAHERPTNDEAIEFATQLGVTVVDLSATRSTDTDTAPRSEVTQAARRAGYPGVIWQADPARQVDYEETAAELREQSAYSIDAIDAVDADTSATVIVGIPTYNEAVSIGSVVAGASQHADEVLVVDDGSTDRTAAVADAAGATVLEHETNRGKGAAVRTLFEHVRSMECDAVVLLDGDGQHNPAQIPDVVQPVLEDDADIVIGSRYLDGSNGEETPRYRRFGQRVLDLLLLGSSRTQVSDSQSGFRALAPAAIEDITLNADSYGVESDMLDAATQHGLEIVEEPIDVRYHGLDSQSQNPFRHGLAVVMFILTLVRDRHPLLFFGVPGTLLALLGVLYGIDGILIYQTTGEFYPAKVLVSGFLTILGTLGVFLGLVLSQMRNLIAEMDT